MARVVRKLFSPNVVIPVVLTAGIVVLLFSFGNPKTILRLVLAFPRAYLLWFLLLMGAYEAIRGAQWWYLLKQEGVRVPLRALIFSFAGGETTKAVPIGNYFQNYLLTAVEGTAFSYSSAVTTLIIWLEVAVSLTVLLILGLDDWAWLRPLIALGTASAALAGWLLFRFRGTPALPAALRRHERLRQALEPYVAQVRQFSVGARSLLRWRVLVIGYLLAAGYLVAAAAALYLVLLGLGVRTVTLEQALVVYCFSLAVGLIVPLPVDIGLIELSGIGALLAIGIERNAALTAMLFFRGLSIGATVAIALATGAALYDQLLKALQVRRAEPAQASQGAAPAARELVVGAPRVRFSPQAARWREAMRARHPLRLRREPASEAPWSRRRPWRRPRRAGRALRAHLK